MNSASAAPAVPSSAAFAEAQAAVRIARRLLAPELAEGWRLEHLVFHCAAGCISFLKARMVAPGVGGPEWWDFHGDGKRWRSGKPSASPRYGAGSKIITYRIALPGSAGAFSVVGVIFPPGAGLPNAHAERLFAWLRRSGQWKSRTQASTKCFGGHLSSQKLSAAIETLTQAGRIECRRVDGGTPIPRQEYRIIPVQGSHQGFAG